MSEIQLNLEEMRKHKFMIATPMYGGMCHGLYTRSLMETCGTMQQYGVGAQLFSIFNESLITRARNYCVANFLKSDCDYLVFIDSDIGWKSMDFMYMLHLMTDNPDKYRIMCGLYPKKTIAWEKVAEAARQGKGEENPFMLENYTSDFVFNPVQGMKGQFKLSEPIEVSEAGTGFMLIPREVLEKYRDTYPEYSYKPDHVRTENFDGERNITAFFDCIIDPVSRRYLSEDYFFCQQARKADLRVWMCPWMQLNHIGMHIFKGNMGAIGSLGVSATADAKSRQKNYKKKPKRK